MFDRRLGLTAAECQHIPHGRFYEPDMKPLQAQVVDALLAGGQAHALFPPVEKAGDLTDEGDWPVETGYARTPDMGISVFCLTRMPRVSPRMWDWWFGWHGCEASRYKLWHPKSHVAARWADGKSDERYVGRTSLIVEYLGSELHKAAIGFVRPAEMGVDEDRLARQGEVAICARVGIPGTPIKAGWLVHHVRPVAGGAEMRSRMWMGGRNAALGADPGWLGKAIAMALRPRVKRLLPDPAELLAHNASEMAHLAGFLPDLFAEFGPKDAATGP